MFDFIAIPIIVGTITYGIYAIFELFVLRRERLIIIDRISNIDALIPNLKVPTLLNGLANCDLIKKSSFTTLKIAMLMIGIGMGVLIGFWIDISCFSKASIYQNEIMYGAPILLCGGLGLLIAFLIELRMNKSIKGPSGNETCEYKKNN